MKGLLSILVVAALVGAGGCSGPSTQTPLPPVDHFTQGGGSMEPTVKAGQVIAVAPVAKTYKATRGDIVLFHGDGQWGPDTAAPFLKRVIAVGGETIACCDVDGRVIINGTGLDERYVIQNASLTIPPRPDVCESRRFDEVKVPEGSIFVMGDNRAASMDSRCVGPLPVTSVFAVMIG